MVFPPHSDPFGLVRAGLDWLSGLGVVRDHPQTNTGASASMALLDKQDPHRADNVSCMEVPELLQTNLNYTIEMNTDKDSNTFLLGMPFFTSLIQIPQRFQDINGTSALEAGLRLLPFTVFSPVGAATAGVLTGKLKISPILVLVVGGIFQTIGLSFMSTLSGSHEIVPSQYGFQIMMGFGFGLNYATLTLMTPAAIEQRDLGRYSLIIISFQRPNIFHSGSNSCGNAISIDGRCYWPGYRDHRFQWIGPPEIRRYSIPYAT